MSRWRTKVKPEIGTVVSSMWMFAVVSISEDLEGRYNIFETSKHKTLDAARKAADSYYDTFAQYRIDHGHAAPKREHFVAQWMHDVNEHFVLVLLDDPKL